MPLLTKPRESVFLVSLVLAIFAFVDRFVRIPYVGGYEFWVMTAAFVLLALGVLLHNL